MSLSERAKELLRRIVHADDEDDPARRARDDEYEVVEAHVFRFDPPLCIPGFSQASITPCGETVRVVVANSDGAKIADGVFRRDIQSDLYRLVEGTASTSAGDAPTVVASITCPTCGKTSYNVNDVRNRYCGNCHKFHAEMESRV